MSAARMKLEALIGALSPRSIAKSGRAMDEILKWAGCCGNMVMLGFSLT
jgi:hypothetical protein